MHDAVCTVNSFRGLGVVAKVWEQNINPTNTALNFNTSEKKMHIYTEKKNTNICCEGTSSKLADR